LLSAAPEVAFAKVNLCLFLGGARADGRHELVTLLESVGGLVDELVISPAPSGEDEVLCPEVSGDNLVTAALAGLRAAGWKAPAMRVQIVKRIPVAAGMGGGSADAAAVLRRAPSLADVDRLVLQRIAAGLGADVPSQLDPGPSLGTGAGDIVDPVLVADHRLVILPQPFHLSTADVYREADRLGLSRSPAELAARRTDLAVALEAREGALTRLPDRLIVNDLQPAAVSLCPEIETGLARALGAGADQAIVCGSGPTVIGIFWGGAAAGRAHAAAERLRSRFPGAVVADPVTRGTRALAPNG